MSPRQQRPEVPTWARPWIASFRRSLRVDRSDRTVVTYCDGVSWFAGWLASDRPKLDEWADVGHLELQDFFIWLRDQGYSAGYRNNIGRCIQAYFKWFSAEEEAPDPFDKIKPPAAPKLGDTPPPVIAQEHLAALIKDAERGRDYESRRDAAILRLFACTGCRLSELANLTLDQVDLDKREATVTGKGGKTRIVKFDHRATRALDRYLTIRAKHRHAYLPALWIGLRRAQGMTPSGIRQVIERRGERIGLDIHPHLFRHTFAHNWLDGGGAEGDLMELAGWDSPQMLKHYGRSARSARARRAYDRIDVMGGV